MPAFDQYHIGDTEMRVIGWACMAALATVASGVVRQPELVVRCSTGEVRVDQSTGSITGIVATGASRTLMRSGEAGLWRAGLQDGSVITSASYAAGGSGGTVSTVAVGAGARIAYSGLALDVVVRVEPSAHGLDFRAAVTAKQSPVVSFELPAPLRFEASAVRRFVCPSDGNMSVGMEFNRRFFMPQPNDAPSSWAPTIAGAANYARLFGSSLVQRADADPPTTLTVTPAGREWLGPDLAGRINGSRAVVNRPPARDPGLLVLVDSPNGPWLSAVSLGAGRAWRLGGAVGQDEAPLAAEAVAAAVGRVVPGTGARGRRVGVIALKRAPERGGWASVTAQEWSERLRRNADVVRIETPGALAAALADRSFAVILNPYGEWCPLLPGADMPKTVDTIATFVRNGGHWIETGGYPFFYALEPVRNYRYEGRYPAMFADFVHLDSEHGSASVYRVQPLARGAWTGRQDPSSIFVPGELACGSDETGAFVQRSYAPYIAPGSIWSSPVSRVALGSSAEKSLDDYCKANGINRRLSEKMPSELLDRFRRSVLLYCSGNAAAKLAALDKLPRPTLVHFADYLHGGFDKQYPDHLPPNPDFGTMDDLRKIAARCRELGLLLMPYTNPTWWCDHPRGPTFEKAGEEPLLRDLSGRPVYERYGPNDGWTICFWHPAVRAANRETVRQFVHEVPVDVLFQDQCGARTWHFDTNPASPVPHAYIEGLLSMVAEDSRDKPLSTESGWDRVAQYESQLCGMSWALVPTERAPEWRRLLRDTYPPETWTIYPLAQRIAHDKASMVHHDLGQFVTNDEVLTWTLGLGFGLSYTASAQSLSAPTPAREWLSWLDTLQKHVCSAYVGQGVAGFRHTRPAPVGASADDGVIEAQYGPVRVAANLAPVARSVGGRTLAPHGFYATTKGVAAGKLAAQGGSTSAGFVAVERAGGRSVDLWVYSPTGVQAPIALPSPVSGVVQVTFDRSKAAVAQSRAGLVTIQTPASARSAAETPPAEFATSAPRDWPGRRPAVGVIDLGEGISPTWTDIQPSDWVTTLQASALTAKHGFTVARLRSPEEVAAALKAGPRAWLAIINPYGEITPTTGGGRSAEMLDAIRSYVRGGGCWWETGGYSHHSAAFRSDSGWSTETIGTSGASRIGVPIGDGPVDAAPVPLAATGLGGAVLPRGLADRLPSLSGAVNRGLPADAAGPPHVTVVTGGGRDYIGGYRLGGWGWYWRIGGFRPDRNVALPVVTAVIEWIATRPPQPPPSDRTPTLHHAVVRW